MTTDVLDLNTVIEETRQTLSPLLTEEIELTIVPQPGLWHVKAHTPQIDQAILNMFNNMIAARDQLAAEYENIVIEIPPGQPQIKQSERSDQWMPRGNVLRCFIEDGGPDGELTI